MTDYKKWDSFRDVEEDEKVPTSTTTTSSSSPSITSVSAKALDAKARVAALKAKEAAKAAGKSSGKSSSSSLSVSSSPIVRAALATNQSTAAEAYVSALSAEASALAAEVAERNALVQEYTSMLQKWMSAVEAMKSREHTITSTKTTTRSDNEFTKGCNSNTISNILAELESDIQLVSAKLPSVELNLHGVAPSSSQTTVAATKDAHVHEHGIECHNHHHHHHHHHHSSDTAITRCCPHDDCVAGNGSSSSHTESHEQEIWRLLLANDVAEFRLSLALSKAYSFLLDDEEERENIQNGGNEGEEAKGGSGSGVTDETQLGQDESTILLLVPRPEVAMELCRSILVKYPKYIPAWLCRARACAALQCPAGVLLCALHVDRALSLLGINPDHLADSILHEFEESAQIEGSNSDHEASTSADENVGMHIVKQFRDGTKKLATSGLVKKNHNTFPIAVAVSSSSSSSSSSNVTTSDSSTANITTKSHSTDFDVLLAIHKSKAIEVKTVASDDATISLTNQHERKNKKTKKHPWKSKNALRQCLINLKRTLVKFAPILALTSSYTSSASISLQNNSPRSIRSSSHSISSLMLFFEIMKMQRSFTLLRGKKTSNYLFFLQSHVQGNQDHGRLLISIISQAYLLLGEGFASSAADKFAAVLFHILDEQAPSSSFSNNEDDDVDKRKATWVSIALRAREFVSKMSLFCRQNTIVSEIPTSDSILETDGDHNVSAPLVQHQQQHDKKNDEENEKQKHRKRMAYIFITSCGLVHALELLCQPTATASSSSTSSSFISESLLYALDTAIDALVYILQRPLQTVSSTTTIATTTTTTPSTIAMPCINLQSQSPLPYLLCTRALTRAAFIPSSSSKTNIPNSTTSSSSSSSHHSHSSSNTTQDRFDKAMMDLQEAQEIVQPLTTHHHSATAAVNSDDEVASFWYDIMFLHRLQQSSTAQDLPPPPPPPPPTFSSPSSSSSSSFLLNHHTSGRELIATMLNMWPSSSSSRQSTPGYKTPWTINPVEIKSAVKRINALRKLG